MSVDLTPLPHNSALDALPTEVLEQRIAELSAHIDAATFRLLGLILQYDERQAWAKGGFRSCAHWLSFRTGVDLGAAREKVRVARALSSLPRVSAAFERAELSYSKVRAITRIADPENEQDWLAVALEGTAAQVEKLVRACRRAGSVEVEQANLQHEGRSLRYHYDGQGMLVLRGRLPAEMGAAVVKALEAAEDALFSAQNEDSTADKSTAEQRTADALILLSQSALDRGLKQGILADKYQVVVHMDAAVLADSHKQGRSEVAGAGGVSAETCRRLACDAGVVIITKGEDGRPLHVGRRTRKINAPLRRALHSRDAQCQFPGCTHTRFLEAHHVQHWAEGGETALDNMVLTCPFHHRLVHEGGFSVEAGIEGGFTFRTPGGKVLESAPQSPALEGDPASGLAQQNQQAGLQISASTNHPRWDGTPVDYGYAVAALLRGTGPTEGIPPGG